MSWAIPVRVRGIDTNGRPFDRCSLADNLSAGGLYFQLPRLPSPSAPLFAVVEAGERLLIAGRAMVIRVERRPHGLWGVGVQYTSAKILARPTRDD